MSGVYQIPPVRDLPSGRLAQRREHLLAEIVRDREPDRAPASMRSPWFRRPKVVALVAATFLLLATACAFGVRALVLDKGFIGLPPEGATPSTPEIGKLVLKYESIHPGTWFWVYADGRVLESPGGLCGGCQSVLDRIPRATPHGQGRRALAVGRGCRAFAIRTPREPAPS